MQFFTNLKGAYNALIEKKAAETDMSPEQYNALNIAGWVIIFGAAYGAKRVVSNIRNH